MKSKLFISGYATTGPFAISVLVTILIFVLQDYFTPVLGSHELCRSDLVLSVSNWTIRKILTHCDQILDSNPAEYPNMDIAILLDIWNAICFTLYMTYTVYKSARLTEEDLYRGLREQWHGKRPSGSADALRYALIPIVVVYSIFCVFFGSPLTYAEVDSYYDLSLSSPFGAVCQTSVAMMGPVGLFVTVVYFRVDNLTRRDPRNKTKTSETKEKC